MIKKTNTNDLIKMFFFLIIRKSNIYFRHIFDSFEVVIT